MAPRTATRKARDVDYSNVGKTGRRTGITLKERQRDEHGFEIIDGSMFESPQKSPPKRNGISSGSRGPSSQSMDLQESSVPEPTEVLTGRQSLRNSDRPILPPPRSRSPIKTSLGSSPRRTPNIRSSLGRDVLDSEETPSRTSLTGSNRLLDFSKATPRLSVEKSSPRTRARLGKEPQVNRSNLRVTQMSNEVDEGYDPDSMNMIDDGNKDSKTKALANGVPFDDYDNGVMGHDPLSDPPIENIDPQLRETVEISIEEEAMPGVEDSQEMAEESLEQQDEEEEEQEGLFVSPEARPQKRKAKKSLFTNSKNRGQKRKSPPAQGESFTTATKKGKGRAPLVSQEADDSQLSIAPKRGNGKAKASKAPFVYRDSDDEEEEQRPTKKARRGPRPKDPNAKMSVRQSKEVDEKVVEIRSRARPPRNLYILRKETPADDSVTHTRSGRLSVRPVAYWRNERCIYGNGEAAEGERFPLATIKEVIRTEEVEVEPSNRGRKAKGRRRRIKEESDEEDSELEDWERDPGMMTGEVWRWEPQIQDSVEISDTLDLAYAHGAIETREVKNSIFRYAKMLSTPFFGSGVVDLPPGSVKNPKNSRKMHMVFFIHTGRVVVTVNGTTFGVGKGGLWQVPRGSTDTNMGTSWHHNHAKIIRRHRPYCDYAFSFGHGKPTWWTWRNEYSIANQSDKPARVFFAQGCEPVEE